MCLVRDFSGGFQEVLEKDLEEDWEGEKEEGEGKGEWEVEMMSPV